MAQIAEKRKNTKLEGQAKSVSKNPYIVGNVQRFDQKYTMFNRPRWDEKVMKYAPGIYGVIPTQKKDGHKLVDRALQNTGWYLEMAFAHGHMVHGKDLYCWEKRKYSDCLRIPEGEKLEVNDPQKMSYMVKKVAKLLGGRLVGICELDPKWVYSRWYNLHTREEGQLELPENCRKYAIAIAVEMDYEMFRTSPNEVEGAATGLGYSLMAFVAGSLAHFIRDLGYDAIASGNDTALSIPIAIDAGLGELGRNGLLITRKYGPRVRLCKVITDLPLVPDEPVEIGVAQFCEICGLCAENCPSNAIQAGPRTDAPLNDSTNPGVKKWPVNGEHCFKFWSSNNTCCGNCIRVCPFNKPDSWFHRMVRWHVRNLPQFDRFYKWMDVVSGYGKQIPAEEWWTNDNNVI
jgi:epoxyqueuosine reductase